MKHKLYSGLQVGKVTLVRRVEGEKGRGPRWICRCECGEEIEKSRDTLTNPNVIQRCKNCFVKSQRAYSNLRIATGLPVNQWSDKP
jgi:hypothetical protein